MEVLKVEVLDVGSKSLTSQGGSGSWEFLLIACCCARGEVYVESVFQPLLSIFMWVFSFSPNKYEHLH